MDMQALTKEANAFGTAGIAETLQLHERAIETAPAGITISDCRLPICH